MRRYDFELDIRGDGEDRWLKLDKGAPGALTENDVPPKHTRSGRPGCCWIDAHQAGWSGPSGVNKKTVNYNGH